MVNSFWVVFLWCPIKVPLVCGFSPSLRMINLKNPNLFAPSRPTNYDKGTYIVSSNLCLFTYPQATDFPCNPCPQKRISATSVFLKFIPVFLMLPNFSNDILIPQEVWTWENWTWHNIWDFLTIKTFRRETFITL